MCDPIQPQRRKVIKLLAAAGLGGAAAAAAAAEGGVGAMLPGQGWVAAGGESCTHDGTPLQFIPKGAPDAEPLEEELAKYPKCPYCGMDRTQWHHSRHLVHYDDGLADGTCSIHCLAISLSLNLDRGPQAIYAADFGSTAEIKPLVKVEEAGYLIGSKLKPTMARKSKMAFASREAAEAARAEHGGELGGFDDALREAYLGMHEDTMMIRRMRAERRKRMMERQPG